MVTLATRRRSVAKTMAKRRGKSLAEGEAVAVSRALRVSPRKLNLVASSIRGLPVGSALQALEFSQRRAAIDVRKCLMSALANAENNLGLDVDTLHVSQAHVGKNIVMKRIRARARGRFGSIRKPFSQLTVVVSDQSKGSA